MTLESQIERLTSEIKALKTAFEQSAATMPLFTAETTFTTSMNSISFSNPSYDPMQWLPLVSLFHISDTVACGVEPIIVTFDCARGINTFANLEIDRTTIHSPFDVIGTYRLPYNNGARWMVTVRPNVTLQPSTYYTWEPTKLKFVVKAAAGGQLGAKMIWQ